MMILKEFSRIVCVSLFSYQGYLLLFSKQLVHIITCSSVCQQLFELLLIEKFKTEKEGFEPSRRY